MAFDLLFPACNTSCKLAADIRKVAVPKVLAKHIWRLALHGYHLVHRLAEALRLR